MKLLNKILFILIAVLAITCEDPNESSSSSSGSTLDDDTIDGDNLGASGNIDDYYK